MEEKTKGREIEDKTVRTLQNNCTYVRAVTVHRDTEAPFLRINSVTR